MGFPEREKISLRSRVYLALRLHVFTLEHRPAEMLTECDVLSRYNMATSKWYTTTGTPSDAVDGDAINSTNDSASNVTTTADSTPAALDVTTTTAAVSSALVSATHASIFNLCDTANEMLSNVHILALFNFFLKAIRSIVAFLNPNPNAYDLNKI